MSKLAEGRAEPMAGGHLLLPKRSRSLPKPLCEDLGMDACTLAFPFSLS